MAPNSFLGLETLQEQIRRFNDDEFEKVNKFNYVNCNNAIVKSLIHIFLYQSEFGALCRGASDCLGDHRDEFCAPFKVEFDEVPIGLAQEFINNEGGNKTFTLEAKIYQRFD